MSTPSMALCFPFCRVAASGQSVSAEEDLAVIDVRPALRFSPLCNRCGGMASSLRSRHVLAVRDLNVASVQVHLRVVYRKVFCRHCRRTVVEDLRFVEPCQMGTRQLARCIYDMCKLMTVADVARHFDLLLRPVNR